MAFDWGGLVTGVLGLGNASNAVTGAVNAANATNAANAFNAAQAKGMSEKQQAEAMTMFMNLLGMSQAEQGPYSAAGKRALLDYEYLASGRRPDVSQYDTAEYKAAKTERQALIDKLATLRSTPVTPGTTKQAVTVSRPGGGWLNKKVHTWTEYQDIPESMDVATAKRDKELADIQMKLMGMGGAGATGFDMEGYVRDWAAPSTEASPLYQMQRREGETAINRQLLARGSFNSRRGMKTLEDFYNQLGAEEAGRMENRYLNLMKMGQGAASATGATGQTGLSVLGSQGPAYSGIAAQTAQNISATQAGLAGGLAGLQTSYGKSVQDALGFLFGNLGTGKGRI